MGYVKSQYLVECQAEDKFYLFNTLNGKIISIDYQYKDDLLSILDCSSNEIQERPMIAKLKEMGFIISDIESEYKSLEYKFLNKYVFNSHLGLTIMPTEQCNFRCVYCYEEFKNPRMPSALQEALVNYVEKNIDKYKGLWVEWFGGEPLLALDVIYYLSSQFINICQAHKKPYRAGMTTNGFLLTPDVFENLYKNRILHYQITLDGNQFEHDQQRVLKNGGKTYETIINNLKQIRDKSSYRLWGITIRTNVSENTVRGLGEYVDTIKKEFGNDRRFVFMLRKMWSNDTAQADSIMCNEEAYDAAISSSLDRGLITQNDYSMSHDLGYICYAAKPHNYVIGADGTIYKCTVSFNMPLNHVGKICANGEVYFDVEKLAWWSIPSPLNKHKCDKCPMYAACMSRSCPAKNGKSNCESFVRDIGIYVKSFAKLNNVCIDMGVYYEYQG